MTGANLVIDGVSLRILVKQSTDNVRDTLYHKPYTVVCLLSNSIRDELNGLLRERQRFPKLLSEA